MRTHTPIFVGDLGIIIGKIGGGDPPRAGIYLGTLSTHLRKDLKDRVGGWLASLVVEFRVEGPLKVECYQRKICFDVLFQL